LKGQKKDKNQMKYILTTIALALAALATSASATPISVDLGPSNDKVIGEYIVPFDSGISSLSGQTLSFDLTFANDEFVRILSTTRKSFIALPWLILRGTGSILGPSISAAYTFDATGERNSWLERGDGPRHTTEGKETIRYGLFGIFPMFTNPNGTPRTDVDMLDFYGIHIDFTLPTSDFEVLGSELLLSPGGSDQWKDRWAIGPHVPETGSTINLLGLGLAILGLSLRATKTDPMFARPSGRSTADELL
jgi:hypothetical protein